MSTLPLEYCHITTSADGRDLLIALVDFVRPITQAYTPCPCSNPAHVSDNPSKVQCGKSDVGQKLLDALQGFIKAALNLQSSDPIKSSDNPPETNTDGPGLTIVPQSAVLAISTEVKPDDVNFAISPSSPLMPNEAFQSSIIYALRSHIFNQMPIRLLAFDAHGTGVRLVERNELFRLILGKVFVDAAQPEVEDAWEGAKQLYFPDSATKAESIVTQLVNRHAKYGILSHTWIRDAPGDVIYRDWENRKANPRGYAKIVKFCEVAARNHGLFFGWMDTICINKDSSSELDESIRSMYKWYRMAEVCVTYLADTENLHGMSEDSWFSRGWTLQELLAPHDSHFYNTQWKALGSNRDRKIRTKIELATSITDTELKYCREGDVHKIPISRKMELAAKRQVTREEDTAYSLMGLLGVDISIAYGEGAKRAFFRLVRELLSSEKHVLDIFNHCYQETDSIIPSSIGQYLHRSSEFENSDSIEGRSLLDKWQSPEPITLTHLGVRIPLLLVPGLLAESSGEYQGGFSGDIALVQTTPAGLLQFAYTLLDSRIYQNNRPDFPEYYENAPSIATFGILNFGTDGDHVLLPQQCLYVPLNCGKIKPGQVRPSDRVKIIANREPPVLRLVSSENQDRIHKDELNKHGMQLVTLYL